MSRWRRPEPAERDEGSWIVSVRTRLALGALKDRYPEVRRVHHAMLRAGGDSDAFESIVAAWHDEYQADCVGPVEHATEADVARLLDQLNVRFGEPPSNVTRLPLRRPDEP